LPERQVGKFAATTSVNILRKYERN